MRQSRFALRAALVCVLSVSGLLAQTTRPNERVSVLIGFRQQPGAAEQALVRAFGGAVRHTYRIIPSIAATLPLAAVRALSAHPSVALIERDTPVYALDEYTSAWGVPKIGARAVHDTANRGAGLKVCVIDSGIDMTHPELAARYAGGYDFVNGDSDPSDDNGHGTHVAGTIAAVLNGAGVVGVAPEAQILAYKILDARGSGSFADAIAAVDLCHTSGGTITNNSYGAGSDPGAQVKQAFDNAYDFGVLHVAAAGNAVSVRPCNSVSYPARYGSVIAVGATNSSDQVASWSCKGAEVELAAPGASIYSTWPGGYAAASGTSMASPHVAGAAALVFRYTGLADLDGDGRFHTEVRARLQDTALDLGTAGRDSSYGYGRVQVDKACAAAGTEEPPPAEDPPPAEEPPAAPSDLRVTGSNPTSISLAWNDNSGDETGFELQRCTGAACEDFAALASLPANTTAYTNSKLARRTTYRYRIRAVNQAGGSAWSNIVSGSTR